MLTGIGGQGVQLGAQTLARAATLEGRHVMVFGTYGGTMRGGNTDCTIVVADEPIAAPPILSRTWSAIAMHHQYWEPTRQKLRPGSVVFLNTTLFDAELDRSELGVVEVPATQVALDLGSSMMGSMVMVGAYAAATGMVSVESLVEAMTSCVPAYRKQHVESNAKALHAGYALPEAGSVPAWVDGD